MVQLASDMPRDVEYPQSYDLVGDSTGNQGNPLRHEGTHRFGRLSLRHYRLEIEDLARRWNRAPVDPAGGEINEKPTLSMRTVVRLVGGFAPDVRSYVVQRSGVPRILGHLMLSVVMAQGDIGPIFQVQISLGDERASVLCRDMADRVFSLHFEMGH